ncbi:hypothetical protein HQ560_19200, partial [bacterium]|nr:hypothetical protein [bacterium]
YRGRIIYPDSTRLCVPMVSGKPIELTIPGYTTQVIELEPGPDMSSFKVNPPAAPAGTLADGAYTMDVTLPDGDIATCDLALIIRGGEPAVTVDGKLTPPSRTNAGSGWKMQTLDLRAHKGKTVRIAISTASPPADKAVIFPKPSLPTTVEAWLILDRPAVMSTVAKPDGGPIRRITYDTAALTDNTRPFPVALGTVRQTVRVMAATKLAAQFNAKRRTLKAADLAGVQAAKLRVRIFGSDGKGRHAKKAIHLNGAPLMPVPVSKGKDTWEEVVVDLPKDALTRIALRNTLRFENRVNDAYKFSAVTLAVRLADGAWVTSTTDVRTHTSQADWRYKEGEDFEQGGMSKEIVVKFD